MRSASILILVLIAACLGKPKPPAPAKPLEVRIVGPVEFQREVVSCYAVQDMPDPPESLTLDYDQEDVIRRTNVNIRDHNDMVDWAHAMMIWAGSVADCLNAITETK